MKIVLKKYSQEVFGLILFLVVVYAIKDIPIKFLSNMIRVQYNDLILNHYYNLSFLFFSLPSIVFFFLVGLFLASVVNKKLWVVILSSFEVLNLIIRAANTYFNNPGIYDLLYVFNPELFSVLSLYFGWRWGHSRDSKVTGNSSG